MLPALSLLRAAGVLGDGAVPSPRAVPCSCGTALPSTELGEKLSVPGTAMPWLYFNQPSVNRS